MIVLKTIVRKIIDSFARQDKRISLIRNQSRLGLFGNYNQLIEKSVRPIN